MERHREAPTDVIVHSELLQPVAINIQDKRSLADLSFKTSAHLWSTLFDLLFLPNQLNTAAFISPYFVLSSNYNLTLTLINYKTQQWKALKGFKIHKHEILFKAR